MSEVPEITKQWVSFEVSEQFFLKRSFVHLVLNQKLAEGRMDLSELDSIHSYPFCGKLCQKNQKSVASKFNFLSSVTTSSTSITTAWNQNLIIIDRNNFPPPSSRFGKNFSETRRRYWRKCVKNRLKILLPLFFPKKLAETDLKAFHSSGKTARASRHSCLTCILCTYVRKYGYKIGSFDF